MAKPRSRPLSSRKGVIITFAQYYATGPEKLWATIFVAAILGILFFIVIRAAELLVLRGRPGVGE